MKPENHGCEPHDEEPTEVQKLWDAYQRRQWYETIGAAVFMVLFFIVACLLLND